jgi:hypothetical protein
MSSLTKLSTILKEFISRLKPYLLPFFKLIKLDVNFFALKVCEPHETSLSTYSAVKKI